MISTLSYFSAKCHKGGQLGHYSRKCSKQAAPREKHNIVYNFNLPCKLLFQKKDGKERYRIDTLHVCIGNE